MTGDEERRRSERRWLWLIFAVAVVLAVLLNHINGWLW